MSNIKNLEILGGRKLKPKDAEIAAKQCLADYDKKLEMNFDDDGSKLSRSLFENNPHIYLNPTEKLVLGNYIEVGDSVATVLGSGDFPLDSIYHGATDVLTFDINKYQYFVGLLKYLGMQGLSYDDFFKFFSDVKSEEYLTPELYKKLCSACNDPVAMAYWNKIMEQRSRDLRSLQKDEMYRACRQIDPDLSTIMYEQGLQVMGRTPTKVARLISGEAGDKTPGSYLESEASYEEARERLKHADSSYIKSDLMSLRTNLQRAKRTSGVDKVYLSNVPEYLNPYDFRRAVNEQLIPMLNDDGSIIYCCQGVDIDTLTKTPLDEALERAKEKVVLCGICVNPLDRVKENSDIIAYQLLKDEYDVSVDSIAGYCEKPDTYVRVKKR